MSRKILTIAALSFGALFSAAHVQAQDLEVRTMEVPVAGLDLNSQQGQREMTLRINAAVKRVCPNMAERDLRTRMTAMKCHQDARAIAAADMARLIQRQQLATISARNMSQH